MPNPALIDANVILRYLLADHAELSAQAARVIDGRQPLRVATEVLCEVVYVLAKVYRVPRAEITATLVAFCRRPHLVFERRETVILALETFGVRSLDIVDALLYARRRLEGNEVITFDQALDRLCREPSPHQGTP